MTSETMDEIVREFLYEVEMEQENDDNPMIDTILNVILRFN